MELLDLHYLITTADAGTLIRAAKVLSVGTSSVSRRISALENELGLSLFERDHAGVRLTPGGNAVVTLARRILSNVDDLKRTARDIGVGNRGAIRLGVRMPLLGNKFRRLFSEWREINPEIQVSVYECRERELVLALGERHIDVAVIPGPVGWPHVAAEMLFDEPVVAALPSGHALASAPILNWKALASESILVEDWDDDHMVRNLYTTFLGNEARIQGHAASAQSIIALVEAGFGITLMTESIAEASVDRVVLRPIAEDNARLPFYLVWPPEIDNPLIGRFIAFLRDRSRALRLP